MSKRQRSPAGEFRQTGPGCRNGDVRHSQAPEGVLSTVYVDMPSCTNSSTFNVDMTPAQCRAARALLDMTQPALARAAGLGLSTVVDFERERRQVSEAASDAIRAALESAGVIFVEENGEGPGVRLKKARP